MKKNSLLNGLTVFTLTCVFCCLTNSDLLAWGYPPCDEAPPGTQCEEGQSMSDGVDFRRTYQDILNRKTNLSRKGVPNSEVIRLGYEDFQKHLGAGQIRTSVIVDARIKMDVKGIDNSGNTSQKWDVPDFKDYNVRTFKSKQLSANTTKLGDAFLKATHAVYNEIGDNYVFFSLNENGLSSVGHRFNKDGQTVNDNFSVTKAPIPLEWGMVYEEENEYKATKNNSATVSQKFEVVAAGTLNTPDEGMVPALKIHHTERTITYKNGEIYNDFIVREICWYSQNGHILKGELIEGSSFTGEVTFKKMIYEKVNKERPTANPKRLRRKVSGN